MRDFFEHQHQAKRKTTYLVLLFALAVILITVLVYFVVAGAYLYLAGDVTLAIDQTGPGGPGVGTTTPSGDEAILPSLWQPGILLIVAPAVILLIGGASAYRLHQLSGGGEAVAASLGGRPIQPDTNDPDERKVLNVVEEMAIASGTPVPPVYVLDDQNSINAFAAGSDPDDAVIGVTRGSIEQLTRDELQGVIAHEFAHILNGDMRLNLRLVGILFGILVIGLIGQIVMRSMFYGSLVMRAMFYGSLMGGGRRRSGSNKNQGGAMLVILAAGLALLIIGYVGVFIGNLIKAAVSRQREYLADASAVQFTRNPQGIGGALKKIGGLSLGARISASRADEFCHMYFGEGVAHHLGSLGSTHPPLKERIQRIDPAWAGEFPTVELPERIHEKRRQYEQRATGRGAGAPAMGLAGDVAGAAGAAAAVGAASTGSSESSAARPDPGSRAIGQAARTAVDQIGQPSQEHIALVREEHIALVRELIGNLPDALREATHEPSTARAVIFAMLIDADERIAERQLKGLAERSDQRTADMTRKLLPAVSDLDDRARLPMIDMTLPALRKLSPKQYEAFDRDVDELIRADEKITFFEWLLGRILRRHLAPTFGKRQSSGVHYHATRAVTEELSVVLSALAWEGAADEREASEAMRLAGRAAKIDESIPLRGKADCKRAAIDEALKKLKQVSPAVKRKVMIACAAAVASDRDITVREGELLRAVADAIGVPMPPLLPGQKVA